MSLGRRSKLSQFILGVELLRSRGYPFSHLQNELNQQFENPAYEEDPVAKIEPAQYDCTAW